MAQNPVAIVASVKDVVVMPDASHIVITLDVGGPKVDLALEPELALFRWSRTSCPQLL